MTLHAVLGVVALPDAGRVRDPFELFADGLALMREEAQELARMACSFIQVDAPDFGQLVDEPSGGCGRRRASRLSGC